MSNNFFLARSRVRVREYMCDGHEETVEIDLVIAEDEAAAEKKVEAYYQAKSDPYCTSYSCDVLDVRPAIT